jgi:hypothetical protein
MPVASANSARNKPIKILLYGASSAGKTHFALSSTPGQILMFDAESGSDFFEGRDDFSFDYWLDDENQKTSSIRELNKAIDYLQSNAGKSKYKTFVIDPISDIYDNLQAQRSEFKDEKTRKFGGNPDTRNEAEMAAFNQKDWADIKRLYKNLILRLKNLPQNIILIAREKEITENKSDGSINKTGEFTYEGEKNTHYMMDFTLRLTVDKQEKRKAIVVKTRSKEIRLGATYDNPSFAIFSDLVNKKGKNHISSSTKTENAFNDEEMDIANISKLKQEVVALLRENGGKSNLELMEVVKKYEPNGDISVLNTVELNSLKSAIQNMKKEN